MILGIDPGARGAIAFLREDGELVDVLDMPAVEISVGSGRRRRIAPQAVALALALHDPSSAYVEKVGAMPGQGVASMFAFGHAAGIVDGALAALSVPITYVSPQAWKKWHHLPRDKGHARVAMRPRTAPDLYELGRAAGPVAYAIHSGPIEYPDGGRYIEPAWCEWNDERFAVRDRNSALHAMARVLVAVGAPDGSFEMIGAVANLHGASLHELANWTIREGDRDIHRIRFHKRPDFIRGAEQDGRNEVGRYGI